MFERDLHNERTNDAVVTIHTPNQDEDRKQENFRSQITRDGNTSLEIEIPRSGANGCLQVISLAFFTIASCFMFFGIFLAANWIAINGASFLWSIILPGIPLLMVVVAPNCLKNSLFTHTIIRITSDNYCLITRNITWRSCFQIMYVPSHFNDLENGEAEETDPKEKSDRRIPALKAKIETRHNEHSVTKYIKLGSVNFAWGFDDDELEWLIEEINRFLRETC
eukprot:g6220.t1